MGRKALFADAEGIVTGFTDDEEGIVTGFTDDEEGIVTGFTDDEEGTVTGLADEVEGFAGAADEEEGLVTGGLAEAEGFVTGFEVMRCTPLGCAARGDGIGAGALVCTAGKPWGVTRSGFGVVVGGSTWRALSPDGVTFGERAGGTDGVAAGVRKESRVGVIFGLLGGSPGALFAEGFVIGARAGGGAGVGDRVPWFPVDGGLSGGCADGVSVCRQPAGGVLVGSECPVSRNRRVSVAAIRLTASCWLFPQSMIWIRASPAGMAMIIPCSANAAPSGSTSRSGNSINGGGKLDPETRSTPLER